MTFKLSFTAEDTTIKAQSGDGLTYGVTFKDALSGKFQEKQLSADALGAILNVAIAGCDEGPLYDAAEPHCSDLANEVRPIP